MEIKDAALYLLIERLISCIALGWVAWKQIGYLRLNQPPEEQKIRIALFMVTLILLGGNIIPIAVDLFTLFRDLPRSTTRINTIGILYAFSNASFAAIAGLGWAFFYWLAEREKVHLVKENRELHREVDDLHQEAADVKQKQVKKDAAVNKKSKV